MHADLMPLALPLPFRFHHRQPARPSDIHLRRRASLQASLAEMVLLNRLRVHTRTDLELDILRRGALVIELTAKHWFTDAAVGHDDRLKACTPAVFFER
jgi:hypothetical protein